MKITLNLSHNLSSVASSTTFSHQLVVPSFKCIHTIWIFYFFEETFPTKSDIVLPKKGRCCELDAFLAWLCFLLCTFDDLSFDFSYVRGNKPMEITCVKEYASHMHNSCMLVTCTRVHIGMRTCACALTHHHVYVYVGDSLVCLHMSNCKHVHMHTSVCMKTLVHVHIGDFMFVLIYV